MSETQSNPNDAERQSCSFPKKHRILRSSDYRRVYDGGMRIPSAYFLAFCLARGTESGPRFGVTAPRSLGKAVTRNRIKRRMREAARQQLWKLHPRWDVVFNPRRSVLVAPMPELLREVDKVFERCKAS